MADYFGQRIKFKGDKEQTESLLKVLRENSLLQFLRPMPEELNFETSNPSLIDAVIGKAYRGFRGVWDDLTDHENERAEYAKKNNPELFEKYKANYEKYGHCTWYTWRNETWGTKGASIEKVGKTYFDIYCAWARPDWVIEDLRKKFDKITFEEPIIKNKSL